MCHDIDLSDHFEHKNKKLSRVEFLRYGDEEWRVKTRDPQDFQNRLRRFEYIQLLEETGWEIIQFDGKPDPKALQDLKSMEIIPRYARTPHDELAILTTIIYARRKS